jgi:toxin HigB-1
MIKGFRCEETAKIFQGNYSRKFPSEIQKTARRRLVNLDSATALTDLGALPGNRLHSLKGNRAGQHSISINIQWRICFKWQNGHAYNVEIVDYH